MARPLRIEYPGAVYHVTARGNARAAIFLDDDDRRCFLDGLGLAIDRYGWLCHGYCLMDNHYHLLLETPLANLSRGMRQVNGVYTQAFNRHHGRVGHVLQGRYKAILVERQAYLLELARYVVLNPVRAGMVAEAGHWPWSSYHATGGLDDGALALQSRKVESSKVDWPKVEWLTVEWLLAQFGGQDAPAAYRQFVAAGLTDRASPLANGLAAAVTAGSVLGDAAFRAKLPVRIVEAGGEVPKIQRHLSRPSLAALRAEEPPGVHTWMVRAQRSHGYTLADIAAEDGRHYSTISKIIKRLERDIAKRKT
ncbi:MAG: transposase [Alphaproteobacteria bacterium]|nr:transposase [Alphaproteobacteria bacterium]